MKGSECKLVEYMDGSKKRFVIPVYQRNYDWKTENCKQLYDDLVKIISQNRRSHFFGSIVSVYNPDGRNAEYLVIDGQQRLTTVSLLFLAMYNLLEKGIVVPETPSLSQQVYEDYLVDKWQPKETRLKLKPVKNDQKAFGKLFDEEKEYIKDSNLTLNYEYFYNRIQKEEISVDQLYDAICSLEIINITLNQEDNPQLIFESLNSTGMTLSEGDKIRNFILMGLPTKQQDEFYEKYWNKIEICTGYDVSTFVRDFLSVKQQAIPAFSKIYFTFKNYVEDFHIDTENLLKELLQYAEFYNVILSGKTNDKRLNSCINRLNRLETTVTRPFFLEALRMHEEGKLLINEMLEIFLVTENYIFRRSICDLPTNMLSKIFMLLHREIIRYDGTEANYLEKFKYALLSKKERGRFPDDDEFANCFESKSIYLMNSKNKMYLLERFENFDTDEDKDVYRHLDEGDYSIEHIMPQHLTDAWVKSLGVDYERIHETWLHRIANLTLTAYNSKYSNSTFIEKRDMKHGFADSGIRMNQKIARKDSWGEAELEERSSYMVGKALDIWNAPKTTFKPAEKQMDSCALDDDAVLNGRQIAKFSYKNMEQPVTSWIDMYERILKILHAGDKTVLSKLAYQSADSAELAQYVSNKKEDLRGYVEIDSGIFAERNTSTWTKISILKRLFKLYNVEAGDLVFYLRDENETKDELQEGSRYELRKRYWTYALEYIHAVHGDNAFSNVNTSKQNWISGFFGVSGFSINCIANYDLARVELYLGKTNKEENKEAYDYLYKYKSEIETELKIELNWQRSEDTKASFITYRLDNVSISNETDWLQMAKFHAEWSKKFYDVIVPYLLRYK